MNDQNSKQERLIKAIRAVGREFSEKTIRELVFSSGQAFRQGIGLSATEIEAALKAGLKDEER